MSNKDSTSATSGQREDEYESPGYELEEPWLWPFNRPRRLRKNPPVPPCRKGECQDIAQYHEFREWIVREWAVYMEDIKLLREEAEKCFMKEGVNFKKKCEPLIKEYLSHINADNLAAKRRQLWEGKRIVE